MAQISCENRIGFALSHKYEYKNFFEFGKDGLVVHSEKNKTSGNKTIWEYKLFDINLKPIKELEVLVDSKKSYLLNRYTNEHIHICYKSKKGDYTIVTTAVPSLDIIKVEGKLPPKMGTTNMAIVGEHVFFELYGDKNDMILAVNWKTGEQKLIPKILDDFDTQVSIVSLLANPENNGFTVHVEFPKNKKKKYDYLVFFDDIGNKVSEVNLSEINGTEYEILSASGNKNDDQQYILTGKYYKKKYEYGMFFNVLNETKVEFSNINNYEELEDPRELADEEAKEKRKEKMYLELVPQSMEIHEPIPMHDGYLLIGEVYHYVYSGGITLSNIQTEGLPTSLQYTHSTLLKFDNEGNPKWNKSFRTWIPHQSIFEKKYINIVEKDENFVKLVYITDNLLKSKKISHDGKIIEEYEFESVKTDRKAKRKWIISNVTHWYDDYLLVYEKQKDKKGKGDSKAISVSKVKYK